MKPSRFGAFVIAAVLSTTALLFAQSTTQRGTTAPRPAPTSSKPIPGQVTPPDQGYVAPPSSASAGSTTASEIPADPLERGYWELYDPVKSITVTGKVRRVDWSMPNSYIYLNATSGQWAIEASFIQFRQSSAQPAVRADETITVTGYLPKEVRPGELPAKTWGNSFNTYLRNNHFIRAGTITTSFGQKLSMGRPPTDAEIAERLKCSPFGC